MESENKNEKIKSEKYFDSVSRKDKKIKEPMVLSDSFRRVIQNERKTS